MQVNSIISTDIGMRVGGEKNNIEWINQSVAYLKNLDEDLNLSQLAINNENVITILHSERVYDIYSNMTHNLKAVESGLCVINGGYTVKRNSEVKVIIVAMSFFRDIATPVFPRGIVHHVHARLIESLFSSLKISVKPQFEILAIANLVGVENHNQEVNCKYNKVVRFIKENASNLEFNLDELCTKVHMSRRKVQYILSDNNTSFLELLNDERAKNFKYILTESKGIPLSIAVEQSGFSSYSNAARVFKKKYSITITEFVSQI